MESHKYGRIMLMWYLVPHNATKELCDGMQFMLIVELIEFFIKPRGQTLEELAKTLGVEAWSDLNLLRQFSLLRNGIGSQ
jgi:hypothetical protein